MRNFALGCLGYDPDRFGRTRVGDFLDAIAGYNEGEKNRIKALASIVRTSTTILWNVQVGNDDKLRAEELWRFPWELDEGNTGPEIPDEERKLHEERQKKYLQDNFPG